MNVPKTTAELEARAWRVGYRDGFAGRESQPPMPGVAGQPLNSVNRAYQAGYSAGATDRRADRPSVL